MISNRFLKQKKSKFVFFVCLIVLIALIISSLYLVEFTEHHCSGEKCPVCLNLIIISNAIKAFGNCGSQILAAMIFIYFLLNILLLRNYFFISSTLIGQKVRLNI